MVPLIRVIYDPYSITEAQSGSFVVNTASEFSHARKIIEDIKAGQPSVTFPCTLIVRQESLLSGFQDILTWDYSFVTFHDASPRARIESALGFSLPTDITNECLISWGIRSERDLPFDADTEKDVQWLLDRVLENVSETSIWSQSAMTSPEWLAKWFRYLLTGETERLCSDEYLIQVIGGKIKQWGEAHSDQVPDDLVELLFKAMSRRSGGQVARQLVARSLVQRYWERHTKWLVTNLPGSLVGVWIKEKLSTQARSVVDQLTTQLYTDGWLDTLVHELDKLVEQEMDESRPEDDVDRYVNGMSGFFPSEYQSVVRRFCNSLAYDYKAGQFDPKAYHTSLSLIAEKFGPLLANKTTLAEDYQAWMGDLLALARSLHNLQTATAMTIEEWWRICTSLMRCEHLIHRLRVVCPTGLPGEIGWLEEEFACLNKRLNNNYGDWLLSKFPEYLGDPSHARLVTQTAWLATKIPETTVILLVIDGLRWDWWQCLARHLAERGYQLESSDSMGLAMLPTVTNISRRAALGRFPLLALIDFIDDVYGLDIDPDEEALLAARVLGYANRLRDVKSMPDNKKIRNLPDYYVYVNGAIADIQQALSLPAHHYVVVYTDIDRAAHYESEEEVLQEAISLTLYRLANVLADEIERNRHFDPDALRLVVTADHGCAHTRWSKQQSLPAALKPYTELDPQIERHGRIAQVVVAGDSEEAEAVMWQVKMFYEENQDEWFVIWGEEASKYGLPRQDKKGRQVIAWLSPRDMDYLHRGTGLYVHGGFSLYETIVPLAVLKHSKERRFIVPSVLFRGLDKLKKENSSTVVVNIGNGNNQELTGVLSIPELRIKEFEIEPVPPGDAVPTEVSVNPTISGVVSLSVTLRYRVGLSEEMEWKEQYTVDIGISRREQMEAETRRELF